MRLMPKSELPPNPYRSERSCPGEYCLFGNWKALAPLQLTRSIESSEIVAEIPEGTIVRVVTGESRGEPEPYAVIEDNGPVLKAGDVIFVLDKVELSFVNYWFKGKLNPDLGLSTEWGLMAYSDEPCISSPDRTQAWCSLRRMRPGKTFFADWWIKITTPDGKEGWLLYKGQLQNLEKEA